MPDINLDLLKRGNAEAFKNLADMYATDVFHIAYCVLFSSAQAHLIAEKTFDRVYREFGSYSVKTDIKVWVCQIAYDEAKKYSLQRNDPSVRYATKNSETEESMFHSEKNNQVIDIEQDIKTALIILPFDQREALLLHDGYQYSYDFLSAVMGISAGIIRSRTSLARAGIKNILLKKWNA